MEDFNRLIESRSISPALVDRIYLWTGNVAIWFHCLILLCPFKTLVINILTLYHPLDTIRWYIGSNTRILFIVIISFLICTLLFLALLKAGERLIYSHHYRPYGSNLETWQIFCAGVSALCFGGLLKWFGLKNCTITVWVVSDAVLWVGLEAYVAWAIMMSEGAFGTYLRQRAYERATARKEEEGRGTSSIAQ
ncbi:hypothetical protein K469DRAFT_707382 [Zopfia rhizophila CBS 207.26]|uniref:Uncharacterized protein n=1 Tax=Zopfia rhizophila CBS 207.26 TaxID=1314779 RepID=A0A6A6E5D1_9PEZI|nr:hypothetical protein K469DRAFT_707382 [Zopfia rhizophila CBS 207.26]